MILKKIVMKHWKLWSFISIGLLIVACSKDNGNENLPPANNNFDRGAMLVNWADNIIVPAYTSFKTEAENLNTAATVFANEPGAVAAPTAGLHFDAELLARLARLGIDHAFLTLHVGAGTFQPVRVERVEDHPMHSERFRVEPTLVEQVAATRARGGRVVAVGTTALRTLEAASAGGALEAGESETDIFIYPGYRFRQVDALVTNFHLPRSTLLMLVSAFAGYRLTMKAYRHAVAKGYRFFSYGDAMWISGRAAVESEQWREIES